ncbi:uncharacterized protein LOC115222355 isoform X3 [Octopus sinensis]|uniref:Membrane magnesium transporter n=1 Tax=Octopus sinensis TaxID=2607531 RepID=A0A7E6FKF0_9MOLL|nr:uncharacterized protein LOC115222355 isoform X3 [Octopus sinensis]
MAFLLRDSMFRKKKTLLLFYFVIDLTTKTFNIKKGILGVTGTNTRQESELVYVLASLSNTVQMGSSSHKICITFGLLVLAHAAYSAAQHRAYLRLIKNDFTRLPLDVSNDLNYLKVDPLNVCVLEIYYIVTIYILTC